MRPAEGTFAVARAGEIPNRSPGGKANSQAVPRRDRDSTAEGRRAAGPTERRRGAPSDG